MPDFGIVAIPTHYTIPPAELGRWAESNGFESLWLGEHSHIPTSRKSPSRWAAICPSMIRNSSIRSLD